VSTDPVTPGLAELMQGEASFAQIITRDRLSRAHLVSAGRPGFDRAQLQSPRLMLAIDALLRVYDCPAQHCIIALAKRGQRDKQKNNNCGHLHNVTPVAEKVLMSRPLEIPIQTVSAQITMRRSIAWTRHPVIHP
jgi:hypothetical protein